MRIVGSFGSFFFVIFEGGVEKGVRRENFWERIERKRGKFFIIM